MRDFEKKAALLRLGKSGWTVDPDRHASLRAHKAVSAESPWPYISEPALPWPQYEILVVGRLVDFTKIDCCNERDWRSQHAVRGDGLVLRSELASLLVDERCYAISVGRTHTENSPGLSVIGPEAWLDPESLVEQSEVVAIHRGSDAAGAWSYGRVDRST